MDKMLPTLAARPPVTSVSELWRGAMSEEVRDRFRIIRERLEAEPAQKSVES